MTENDLLVRAVRSVTDDRKVDIGGEEVDVVSAKTEFTYYAYALRGEALNALYNAHSLLIESKYYENKTKRLTNEMMKKVSVHECDTDKCLPHMGEFLRDYQYRVSQEVKNEREVALNTLTEYYTEIGLTDTTLMAHMEVARQLLMQSVDMINIRAEEMYKYGMDMFSEARKLILKDVYEIFERIYSLVTSRMKVLNHNCDISVCEQPILDLCLKVIDINTIQKAVNYSDEENPI